MICARWVGPTSYNGREGVQAGSESSNAVRVGGVGTGEKTGGGDGGGIGEDVMDNIRHEYIRGTSHGLKRKHDVVWTYTEEI